MPGRAARRRPVHLRRRLTIAFVLVAGVSTAALALGSYIMLSRARFDESLSRAAGDVRYQLILAQQFLPLDDERTTALLGSFEAGGHHVVLVKENEIVASNQSWRVAPDAGTRAVAASGRIAFQRGTSATAGNVLMVGGRVPGSTAELYVVHPEDRVFRELAELRAILLAAWAAVVIVAAAAGWSLARGLLEPVGRASRAARAVADGLLATRLPVPGRGERDGFGAWAESFNRMAEALEVKINRERRFTSDVAHELRTPVTALVAAASLLGDQLRDDPGAFPADARRPAELLVGDAMRLRRLVDELMEISRLDAGQEEVIAQPLDLTGHVRAVVAGRGWDQRVQVSGPPVRVWTDPRRLERIVANLVANAVEHGGTDVRAEISADGPIATVSVSDRGPGIAAEHLPRVFERFFKADPARSSGGSGLGLAIARENARLLGADLRVRSEVGVGTEFRLEISVTRPLPGSESLARADR